MTEKNKFSKTVVISLSGGLDSTSLMLHFLAKKYKVYGLSFDYGQKHKIELQRLKKNVDYLKSINYSIHVKHIDISDMKKLLYSSLTTEELEVPDGSYELENMVSTVVPNRNMIFFSLIASYALSLSKKNETEIEIALGAHSGDHALYPDCTPEFYEKAFAAFKEGNWGSEKISINMPYITKNKSDIVSDALISCDLLKLDFNQIMKNTLSSYEPTVDGKSSGNTSTDIERILAFHDNGIVDPIEYTSSWEDVLKNALKNVN